MSASPRRAARTGVRLDALEPRVLLSGEPLISELMAVNTAGLVDEDGDRPDWIELYNPDAAPRNLDGWYLTDDAEDLTKWRLPAVTVPADGYLVIFASDKDRAVAGAELHTSFKLDGDGEYLALVRPDGATVVHAYAPQFPPQQANISYGLVMNGGALTAGYLASPTPGTANSAPSAGFVEPVEVSHARGLYDAPFDVTLATATPGAQIRYTLDGSAPTATHGAVYAGPVHVSTTATLRALAWREDLLATEIETHTYIFLDDVVHQPNAPAGFPANWIGQPAPPGDWCSDTSWPADYGMDPNVVNSATYGGTIRNDLRSLPILSLVMDVDDLFGPHGIYANSQWDGAEYERPGSAELIDPDGQAGFQIDAGVRIHGGWGRRPDMTPKHSFRLLFKDLYDGDLEFPLFATSDRGQYDAIVVRANFNDSWAETGAAQFLRDQWMRDTQLAMGRPSPHGNWVHLYVNGLYWGLYNPVERPTDDWAAEYFGGDSGEYDVIKGEWDALVQVNEGSIDAWTQVLTLAGRDLSVQANYDALAQWVDIPNLVDYMILNLYGGTQDWPNNNWYAVRRRAAGEGFKFVSWDAEASLNNWSDLYNDSVGVDRYNTPAYLYARLRNNAEFRLLFADRVYEHFFNDGALTTTAAVARWTALANEIDRAVVGESARWGDDINGINHDKEPPYTRSDWVSQRSYMLNTYLPQRTGIVLQQLRNASLYPNLPAATFGQHGGRIAPGFGLTMTAPSGTIYYTLDGTDPRLPGGQLAPGARAYTPGSPVVLAGTTLVKARVRSGSTWSALHEALFAVDASALRVDEIAYHPAGGETLEFVELVNTGSSALDISGVSLPDGLPAAYAFPMGTWLPAGGRIVVVPFDPADAAARQAFLDAYGLAEADVRLAGPYVGRLANEGERVVLADALGTTLLDFTYDNALPWPEAADGGGPSLQIIDPLASPADPANWRSAAPSPGAAAAPADATPPRVEATSLDGRAAQHTWTVSPGGEVVVELQLSEPVTLAAGAAQLTNRATGQPVAVLVEGDGTATVRVRVSAAAMGQGRFRLALSAAGVHDAAGNPLDGNGDGTGGDGFTCDFHRLIADFDGDAAVGLADLAILATHWNSPAGAAEGDLDGDGQVGLADLALLASHWNETLPAPLAASRPAATTRPASASAPPAPRAPRTVRATTLDEPVQPLLQPPMVDLLAAPGARRTGRRA